MSSQDSDLLAEISKIKDGDGLHSVSAESSMSSQDSDPFSEISKIISTSQDDGLAKQATNCHAFPQKRSAIAGTSSQDSDPICIYFFKEKFQKHGLFRAENNNSSIDLKYFSIEPHADSLGISIVSAFNFLSHR
jgi:hypothetical protein